MKLTDPGIYSIIFISMVEGIYILGVSYFISLQQKIKLSQFFFNALYGVFTLFIVLNYFLVYRRAKQYEYYSKRLNPYLAGGIIVLAYVLMAIGGQIYREVFSVKR